MAVAGDGVGNDARTAEVTLARWSEKVSDLCMDKYAFTAVLKAKNKIKYGQGGGQLRWPFRFRDHDITGHVDGGSKEFTRVKTIDNAYLDWRGFEASEAITLMDRLVNSGKWAVIEIFRDREKYVREGLMRQLGKKWHRDGDSTAGQADNRFHGIESFGSFTGQTATDEFATTPNDTYGSHSTSYTTFKTGATKGTDEEYGVWSPVLVNCNRSVSGATRTWDDYADEYIRAGLLEAARGNSPEDQVDLILLNKSAYKSLLNIADDKERLVFERGDSLGVVKLGFTQFVQLDGCMIGWDFGVPDTNDASTTVYGYGYNMDKVELCMLNRKSLWESKINWNWKNASDLLYFYCLGNLKFDSPRWHILFKAISS